LIELLIVTAIIAIMTAGLTAGLRIQRTNYALFRDAQRVTGLLEKARAYAANPRNQDTRPLYYLVSFLTDKIPGTDFKSDTVESSRIFLIAHLDTNNDGIGDIQTIVDEIQLENTHLTLSQADFGPPIENAVSPGVSNFKTCTAVSNPPGIATGSIISLGYRVGKPQRVLGRCWPPAGNPSNTVGTPGLIFNQATLRMKFNDDQFQSDFDDSGGKETSVHISGWGEVIETIQ
jgi:type II secretory pathway pseudopilin PulG